MRSQIGIKRGDWLHWVARVVICPSGHDHWSRTRKRSNTAEGGRRNERAGSGELGGLACRHGVALPRFLIRDVRHGVGVASPLLRLIGQDEGAIFYQCGESSTGKDAFGAWRRISD